ncbi:CDP-diacylglycerol--inositol 3-phosphatidyltransferase [Trichoderma longibrachiatum ATCC 18648]|uniref:CDP-diacylglycerol--inositol 3-phosphatidyltransferase n=1 Tax=Trichoderma longibrachiatum ATCC 18648 TaxID=983965 RepID=A0A2T4CC86_TRILO|nr:CDP-diacylglycerol--inositol 3-phosphatidyltransferase [Trichoderma longibrachiatum ATCC 18648]
MSAPRTRRRAAQEKLEHGSDDDRAAAVVDGNGSARDAPEASDSDPDENIFLFWPNIIGYCRIVLAIASLYYMPLHPRTCTLLYSISCLLDALDGYAARAFNQSTRFGAVLDMVTDRCTTSCLLTSGGLIQPGVPVNTSLLRQLFPDPFSAAALEFARANKMDSTVPWVITGISFPIMLAKQIINVVQLVKASKWLAEVDIKTRKAKGLNKEA